MSDESKPPKDEKLRKVAANVRHLKERANIPLDDEEALTALDIYVGKGDTRPPPDVLTEQLAGLLQARGGLYLHGRDLVTINERTGQMEEMEPHTFVTWVPMVARIVCHAGKKTNEDTGKEKIIPSALSVEQARLILASHEMREKMPEILTVNRVPLPVYRDVLDERDDGRRKGFKKIEWLKPGYDADTKSFTVHGGPVIDDKLDGMEAAGELFNIAKTFDFSDKNPQGMSNRMAVHFALGVTTVARYLFPGKSPVFLYGSNLEGSGKGALIKMAMMPVFRTLGSSTVDPSDKVELLKLLNTKAESGDPYLLADEMPEDRELNNQHLARWTTENVWEKRGMGQDKQITKSDIKKVITVLAGNRMKVNRNLGRRILHIDLFPHQEAADRQLPADVVYLGDSFFDDVKNVDRLLNCYAALIRMWDEMGRPGTKDKWLKSFDGWSEIVPGIIECANLGRPLVPFEAAGSGDDDSRLMKKLTTAVIDAFCFEMQQGKRVALPSAKVKMKDIVRTARLNNLFTERLGTVDGVMETLLSRKGHEWKLVEYVSQEDLMEGGKAVKSTRQPTEPEKRLQAAEWMDSAGPASGSAWGKFFGKMAVDDTWRVSSCGLLYKFGDRGSSRQSEFVLRRQG